ncbi:hypothetical protein JWS13_27160 [Rhodococcus pseudokoreensis]|uniref:Uncharacterized protein n=1 Tax=Rhodococcus pseudokoreensis TaxID=2811421 RepID=A0A974W6E1_9NOCA|nr:hypothetical protein [Rhodococcus pseudokoreensis]QSE92055.1 hypothetical protein JWS13_27160 [Rhodococcus pseudokoreensis]
MIDAYRAMFAEGSEMIAAVLTLLATDAGMATIVKDEESMVYTPPEVMLGFLDAFRGDHGSFDDFVESIGRGAEVARIRQLLTAGG